MKESRKTKAQPIEELDLLRQRIKTKGLAKSRNDSAKQLIKDSEIRYRRFFETVQDGILIIDAEPDKGSTFYFTLPIIRLEE
jgi:hypothetical protein